MDNTIYLNDCISKLESKEINDYFSIPEEYRNIKEIVRLERKLGIRKSDKRGYDVIQDAFFVEEIVLAENYAHELIEKAVTNTFANFESYYEFLEGDIYNNACYFQYHFSDEVLIKYHLDIQKLNIYSSLEMTIDDYFPEASEDEKEQFAEVENQMAMRKRWIKKYNACTTFAELVSINKKHEKSQDNTDELFYFWNYINYHGTKSFKTIMQFVSQGQYPAYMLENALCNIYDPEKVLKAYDYKAGAPSTNKKHNNNFKKIVNDIVNIGVIKETIKFFDSQTHYYCVKTELYLKDNSMYRPIAKLYKYFETFEEFVDYLGNDISDCDLSDSLSLKTDFTKYKFNDATKFPIGSYKDLTKQISKCYNRYNARFDVVIKWYNSENIEVCNRRIRFKYFFDFVAFLKSDLSDADLLFCDGLENLLDYSSINLTDAKLRSSMCQKIGITCNKSNILNTQEKEFAISKMNEHETELVLHAERNELFEYENVINDRKIFYITDLHLMHRIHHAHCITKEDCIYVTQKIIDRFFEGDLYTNSIILIGGDIASDYEVFSLFVTLLRKTLDERKRNTKVIFTLGNHELWGFQENSIDEIVQKYRMLLTSNRMHLLHNEIIYTDDNGTIGYISSQELYNLAGSDIREKLRSSRVILFGGIGFSGYNQEFNANDGIYRMTLSREQEIMESRLFESLYDKVCSCLPDRNIIVLTHMPLADWHLVDEKVENYIYVSGHNHKNTFYDDGSIRIYADNQVGYHSENPRLKYFYVDDKYDWFSEFQNGIYEITREDYVNFYRGKNLSLTFNRDINELYMLKKNGYYCFIHKNTSGGLTILNGGSLKTLKYTNLEYYYENMEAEIAFIKSPLDKYQAIQKQISVAVRDIGGLGHIHGAIVDIDRYNHIYVNPNDLTVTAYFAWDMIEKYVYPNVPALLEANCPSLYANYTNAIEGKNENALALRKSNNTLLTKPKLYLSTDIYVASRELKKMQKINSDILSAWYDNIPGIKQLPQNVRMKHTAIGEMRKMSCGMFATIVAYVNYDDITVQFEDGTIVEHVSKSRFLRCSIQNPNIKEEPPARSSYSKISYVGKTNMMKCGLKATVIEDFGCKDITVQFEDGLIRKHRRRDHFDLGKIAHIPDIN